MKVKPDNPHIFRNSLLTEYHQRYSPCGLTEFVFIKRRWGKGLDRGRSEGNIWLECSECRQVHQLKEIIHWIENEYRAVPAETVTGDDYPKLKRYQDEPEYKEWLAQMVVAEKEDTPYPKFPFKVGSDA